MKENSMLTKNGTSYLLPFIMVTSLFALWGFAHDITNPMVSVFKTSLLLSNTKSALVQSAFYGGYCFMAIPAALFIRRFNYRKGILLGLLLYATGCLLFFPAANLLSFWAFLLAYFIMTCGLAFLETTSNPYILSMGGHATATRRLNLAQAFNPMGSLCGMLIASQVILTQIEQNNYAAYQELQQISTEAAAQIDINQPYGEQVRQALQENHPATLEVVQSIDMNTIKGPYLALGCVVLCFFCVFLFVKLPRLVSEKTYSLRETVRILLANKKYLWSVLAQAFYVGVQIMVWTFIIQYAESELGMPKDVAQRFNIVAMSVFVGSRFICTFLLKYFSSSKLLTVLAIGGALLIIGTIGLPNAPYIEGQYVAGYWGLYCLMAVSACMSLMFPTIYGIALGGMGDEAKLASAGLILAIGGGCFMPPLQGFLMDNAHWFASISSIRLSFVLPLICFIAIALYGRYTKRYE